MSETTGINCAGRNSEKDLTAMPTLASIEVKCRNGVEQVPLDELVFDPKKNHLRSGSDLDLDNMVRILTRDEAIMNPLIVGTLASAKNDKLFVICGNRRGLAAKEIRTRRPDLFQTVPCKVYINLTDAEFLALAQDNLAVKEVTLPGLFEHFLRLRRLGYNGLAITVILAPYFRKLSGVADLVELDKKLAMVRRGEVVSPGKDNEAKTEEQVLMWHFRRKYQNFLRMALLFKEMPELKQLWLDGLNGVEGGLVISTGQLQKCEKALNDTFKDKGESTDGTRRLAELVKKHNLDPKVLGVEETKRQARRGAVNDILYDGADARVDPPAKVTRKDVENVRDTCKSGLIQKQMEYLLTGEGGDDLIDLEMQYVVFDQAYAIDPAGTIAALQAIIDRK